MIILNHFCNSKKQDTPPALALLSGVEVEEGEENKEGAGRRRGTPLSWLGREGNPSEYGR